MDPIVLSSCSSIYSQGSGTENNATSAQPLDLSGIHLSREWRLQLKMSNSNLLAEVENECHLLWLPYPSEYAQYCVNPFADDEFEMVEDRHSTSKSTQDGSESLPRNGDINIDAKEQDLVLVTPLYSTPDNSEPEQSLDRSSANAPKDKPSISDSAPDKLITPVNDSGDASSFLSHSGSITANQPLLSLKGVDQDPVPIPSPQLDSARFSFSESVAPSIKATQKDFDEAGKQYGFAYGDAVTPAHIFEVEKSTLRKHSVTNKRYSQIQELRRSVVGSVRGIRNSMSSGNGRWSLGTARTGSESRDSMVFGAQPDKSFGNEELTPSADDIDSNSGVNGQDRSVGSVFKRWLTKKGRRNIV